MSTAVLGAGESLPSSSDEGLEVGDDVEEEEPVLSSGVLVDELEEDVLGVTNGVAPSASSSCEVGDDVVEVCDDVADVDAVELGVAGPGVIEEVDEVAGGVELAAWSVGWLPQAARSPTLSGTARAADRRARDRVDR